MLDYEIFLNLENIKKKIDSYDVISFDVFDTLVLRPFAKPEDLFLYIEKVYNCIGFYNARMAAGEVAALNTDDEEVTLDEIYLAMDCSFLKFKEIEKRLEINLSSENAYAKKLYDYALEKGKKIIFISDMYLDENTVERILFKNGYKNFELFLSSSYKLQKNSGNLFCYAISKLGVKPQNMLHIGNSKEADYKIPKSLGISSVWLQHPAEYFLKHHKSFARYYYSNYRDVDVSILIGLCSQYYAFEENDYWFSFGYLYGGPVISSFSTFLKNEIKPNTSVAFIARDCYTIKKVFDYITRKEFDTSYIYANRRIKLLLDINFEHFEIWPDVYESSIDSIISFYCSGGFGINFQGNRKNLNEKIDFIIENKQTILNASKQYKDKYTSYLSSNVVNKNIAIVDGSTMNFSAQKLVTDLLADKDIVGYYFYMEFARNSLKKPIAFKYLTFQKTRKQIYYNWDFMEFILSSPEYPISFIENGKAVYEKCDADSYRCSIYENLSEGAFAFSKQFFKYFKDEDYNFDPNVIANFINYFCLNFNRDDVKHLKKIYQIYSGTSIRSIVSYNKKLKIKIFMKKFIYKINRVSLSICGRKVFYKKIRGRNTYYCFLFFPLFTRSDIYL